MTDGRAVSENNRNDYIEGVIIKGVGGLYSVAAGEEVINCTARGVFRNKKITPIPGDRVIVKDGAVHELLPRRNELVRPRVANIDQAVIVMAAAQPEFNPGLLDRFLLLTEQSGVRAVICVNKSELAPTDEMTAPYIMAGYTVLIVSASDGTGIEALRQTLVGRFSVFAGPSGVGKSSIINLVTAGTRMETGGLSAKIERGKHTTRHTELLPVLSGGNPAGGYCADTPGFTSLDVNHIPAEQLAGLFMEFKPFLNECRFSDCRHHKEQDCAVKAAVGTSIHPARYDRYLRLLYNLNM